MACLVAGFVTLKITTYGRINIGTAIHYRRSCTNLNNYMPGLVGQVVKVEGELAKKLPICKLCEREHDT